jgi:lysophospholipase L1-like esterase
MKFILFGDSICYGQFVSPDLIWATKLSKFLNQKSKEFWVNNSSVSGNTTRMALERMPFDVQSHGIDILYTQFGLNDCNYWKTDHGVPRVSKKAFKSNLIEIIQRGRIFGAKNIIIGTNHPSTKTSKFEGLEISFQESNELYNETIRDVAAESNVILVDHEKIWKSKSAHLNGCLLPDQIHMSEKGHQLYYESVLELLIKNDII